MWHHVSSCHYVHGNTQGIDQPTVVFFVSQVYLQKSNGSWVQAPTLNSQKTCQLGYIIKAFQVQLLSWSRCKYSMHTISLHGWNVHRRCWKPCQGMNNLNNQKNLVFQHVGCCCWDVMFLMEEIRRYMVPMMLQYLYLHDPLIHPRIANVIFPPEKKKQRHQSKPFLNLSIWVFPKIMVSPNHPF